MLWIPEVNPALVVDPGKSLSSSANFKPKLLGVTAPLLASQRMETGIRNSAAVSAVFGRAAFGGGFV